MGKSILIITVLIIIFIGSSVVFALKKTKKPLVTITMTETGFSPAKFSFKKGVSVKFINRGKELRWPASNIHPSHGIYPEFDPRKPIEASGMWIFKFDKIGTWRFHDHLNPELKGVVTVE